LTKSLLAVFERSALLVLAAAEAALLALEVTLLHEETRAQSPL